jgi:predicted GIY-YIG superfamily endonuclease
VLRAEFPNCDWQASCAGATDEDDLWASFEQKHGNATQYTGLRESAHMRTIAHRSARLFAWLQARPEREIVVVSHAAFLRSTMSFGAHRKDLAAHGIEPVVSDLACCAWRAPPRASLRGDSCAPQAPLPS